MNYAEAWKRLTWVLMALWSIFWIILLVQGGRDQRNEDLWLLLAGNAIIFALARAIAWIASGLSKNNS